MPKFFFSLFAFFFNVAAFAQTNGLQFRFSTERLNDSTINFIAKANMEKGLQLFSTNKITPDAAFASSIQFEANLSQYLLPNQNIFEKGTSIPATKEVDNISYSDSVSFSIPLRILLKDSVTIKGEIVWLGKQADSFPSGTVAFNMIEKSVAFAKEDNTKIATTVNEPLKGWQLFLLCFFTGLAAVFTPCVFPLIPVTVSFFLKKSKTKASGIRNAWMYALSIILIYTIPTLILTLVFGDKFLYQLSTHPITNLFFFLIFIVFSISFFGAFELTLPSSWANKADSGAGKGGFMGVFFMALTLVIVSFSCTGPIVAGLLSQTSGTGVSSGPIVGMLGFGFGLAIPFGIFAFFPSLMKSMPKSGGWLNTVKVFFGFIELALAMKFLSNADLVYHWHLLNRDLFLTIWIVIALLLGFYLLGKIKFSHDSDLPYVSVPRLFFALFAFCFGVYLIPGLWGAPLTPLTGILPPASTQEFNLEEIKYKIGNTTSNKSALLNNATPPKKYVDKFHVPFGLQAYFDMEEAKQASAQLGKPIMIDFTGWSCANCRKMENEVWSKPEVLQKIKENFILVSLYVDDKTELAQTDKYTNANGELIETIGAKNLDFEKTNFKINAQPLYKFVNEKGTSLSDEQYGYDNNVDKFLKHLDDVLIAYKK